MKEEKKFEEYFYENLKVVVENYYFVMEQNLEEEVYCMNAQVLVEDHQSDDRVGVDAVPVHGEDGDGVGEERHMDEMEVVREDGDRVVDVGDDGVEEVHVLEEEGQRRMGVADVLEEEVVN